MLENLKQLIRWDPPNDKGGGDKPTDKPTKTPEQVKKEAKEKAIAEVKANPGEAEVKAEDMVAKAKKQADTVEGADDKAKTDAKTKLDGAAGEFADIVALLKKRLQLKTDLAKLNPTAEGFDFLHAQDVIRKAKADKASLSAAFGEQDSVVASVDGKEKDVNTAAKAFYDGIAKIDTSAVTDAPDKSNRDFTSLMAQIGKMQEAKSNNFPGVDEATQKSLSEDFSKKIASALKDMEAHQKEFDKLSPEDKESFKRLKFAVDNLTAAENSDNDQHKAGAEQYMQMVLAEQEARRVWESLPVSSNPNDSWRADSITGTVDAGWNKEGENYRNYTAALDAFNKALKLSVNKETGDSTKARDLFKEAANKWREVLSAVQKQNVEASEKLEKDVTAKKGTIEEFLKKNSLDLLPAAAQKDWLDGKTAFDTKNFKEAGAKFDAVLKEIERINKGEFNEEDRKAAQEAADKAKTAFEAKYGSHPWAKSVIDQANAIHKQIERSGVTTAFGTNILKDVVRIYSEAGAAITAYDRVMAAFKKYQSEKGANIKDVTADIIYRDGAWRFDRGAFVEAAQKLNDCAQIYEDINAGKVDSKKSNAVIDGKVQEGTKAAAEALKGKMTDLMARSTKMAITNLTRTHLVNAEAAMKDGYWARAINQYKQIESMVTGAEAAADVYYKISPLPKPGTDSYDYIQQGNNYYNAGSFAEAKTYYENAKKAYDKERGNKEPQKIASN